MFLPFKWMDNLQKIEHRQTKCHLLFIFRLTCSKFFALKRNALTHSFQNHFSNHTITPIRVFIMGSQDVPLREESGGTPCKPRRLNFLLLLEIAPNKTLTLTVSPGLRPHIGKKMVSLIAFRQNLPRTLPAACIFSYTIMTYLKSFDGTKSLNAKQYPAVLTT